MYIILSQYQSILEFDTIFSLFHVKYKIISSLVDITIQTCNQYGSCTKI